MTGCPHKRPSNAVNFAVFHRVPTYFGSIIEPMDIEMSGHHSPASMPRIVTSQLREADVAGCIYKAEKLAVGYGGTVDPEPIDIDPMRRRLLRVVVVGAHMERTAGNPNHPLCACSRGSRMFGGLRRIRTFANGV